MSTTLVAECRSVDPSLSSSKTSIFRPPPVGALPVFWPQVRTFVKNEDQNFSLFNYVNEQQNEVEKLEEQLHQLEEEEQKFTQVSQFFKPRVANKVEQPNGVVSTAVAIMLIHEQHALREYCAYWLPCVGVGLPTGHSLKHALLTNPPFTAVSIISRLSMKHAVDSHGNLFCRAL